MELWEISGWHPRLFAAAEGRSGRGVLLPSFLSQGQSQISHKHSKHRASQWDPENCSLGNECSHPAPGCTMSSSFQKSIFSPKPKWKNHIPNDCEWFPVVTSAALLGAPPRPRAQQDRAAEGRTGSRSLDPHPGTEVAESLWNLPEAPLRSGEKLLPGELCLIWT